MLVFRSRSDMPGPHLSNTFEGKKLREIPGPMRWVAGPGEYESRCRSGSQTTEPPWDPDVRPRARDTLARKGPVDTGGCSRVFAFQSPVHKFSTSREILHSCNAGNEHGHVESYQIRISPKRPLPNQNL